MSEKLLKDISEEARRIYLEDNKQAKYINWKELINIATERYKKVDKWLEESI